MRPRWPAARRTRAAGPDGARVPLGLSSGDVSTRSSDVNEPQINVDHFYHRPTYHVVGLLPEQSEIPALSRETASPPCSPPWTWPPARWWTPATPGTAIRSS